MARQKCTEKDITMLLGSEDNEDESHVPDMNVIKRKKRIDQYENDDSNDSDCVCMSVIPRTSSTRSSTLKANKRDHVSTTEKNKNNVTPKVPRIRFSRCVDRESKRKTTDEDEKITNYKISVIKHESLDATPKRRTRIQDNSHHRGILTVSNKCEPTITENKTRNRKSSSDEVDVMCAVAKELSIKQREKKDLKNTVESSIAQNMPSTPKSSRLKPSALTPSAQPRTKALSKPATPLQEARSRLHVSAVPKSLPCREKEFNEIYTFLESKLMDNSGG